MMSYLSYMAERLAAMERLLKPTGSIYLHCDPTASHYLKVIMDDVFGAKNFRNEITWKRYATHSLASGAYDTVSDIILFYSRTENNFFDCQYGTATEVELAEKFPHTEKETGRKYQHAALEKSANKSSAGEERIILGRTVTTKLGWIWSQETFDERIKENPNLIYWTRTGRPRYKIYEDEYAGIPLGNIWVDVPYLSSGDKERLGYPTQKPRALLERIIESSCPHDGLVMDPFCGCGTAIDAARKLKRQWIGIDISAFAIDLIIAERLKDPQIQTAGIPLDLTGARKFAKQDRFGFEKWAITRMPGFIPNQKQVGDGGIDGQAKLMNKWNDLNLALAQVKSGALGGLASDARDFLHVMDREQAVCGVFITTEKVGGKRSAHREFADMGRFEIGAYNFPRAQLWSIEEYFEGRMPNLPPMLNPYTGEPMAQAPLI